jgi:hypothetical protein
MGRLAAGTFAVFPLKDGAPVWRRKKERIRRSDGGWSGIEEAGTRRREKFSKQ